MAGLLAAGRFIFSLVDTNVKCKLLAGAKAEDILTFSELLSESFVSAVETFSHPVPSQPKYSPAS